MAEKEKEVVEKEEKEVKEEKKETKKKNKDDEEWLKSKSYEVEDILNYFPKYYISEKNFSLFINGTLLNVELDDGIYNIYIHEKYLGTGVVKNKELKRDVILDW